MYFRKFVFLVEDVVTHACFEPNELVKYYPRGEKELRGPFHQFSSGDTIEWFENMA
jgi:predicted flavoprotein YhiN